MSGRLRDPWTARITSWGEAIVERGREGGFVVAGSSPAQEIDDAYLIAAAPDLLRELSHLVKLLQPLELTGLNVPGLATLNGARAALAKAKGLAP